MERNRHHIFYPRNQWNTRKRKRLRDHELSVVKMDTEEHQRMHRYLHSVEHLFYPSNRSIGDMLDYSEYILHHETNHFTIEQIVNRIETWAKLAYANGDHDTHDILMHQTEYIINSDEKHRLQSIGEIADDLRLFDVKDY